MHLFEAAGTVARRKYQKMSQITFLNLVFLGFLQ